MKSVLFLVATLFASLSVAGMELKIDNTSLNTTDGSFQQSDGSTLTATAPWITLSGSVTNNTAQTVTIMTYGITPGVASHKNYVLRVDGLVMAPGDTFAFSTYIDALPGDNINYAVFEIDGVVGNDTNPIPLVSGAFSIAAPTPPATPAPTAP